MTKFTSFLSLAELPEDIRTAIECRQRDITEETPLRIVALCNDLGINVVPAWESQEVDKCFMGLSYPLAITKSRLEYTIFYNKAHSIERQRFSVAHGLAHIILDGEGLFNSKTAKHSPSPGGGEASRRHAGTARTCGKLSLSWRAQRKR